MKHRTEIALEHINRQIEDAKEELEEKRKEIAKRAKTGSANSIMELVKDMKAIENKIHSLWLQLEVVKFIKDDTFITEE